MLALVLGEAASGKSEFAEQLAMSLADERYYIATMQVSDSESQQRIERHRQMRQGKGFVTLEQPLAFCCMPSARHCIHATLFWRGNIVLAAGKRQGGIKWN